MKRVSLRPQIYCERSSEQPPTLYSCFHTDRPSHGPRAHRCKGRYWVDPSNKQGQIFVGKNRGFWTADDLPSAFVVSSPTALILIAFNDHIFAWFQVYVLELGLQTTRHVSCVQIGKALTDLTVCTQPCTQCSTFNHSVIIDLGREVSTVITT